VSIWDSYPPDYRSTEVNSLLAAVSAGECAALLGLSGSGKSNLLGFLANRTIMPERSYPPCILADCNRMEEPTPAGFYRLILASLGAAPNSPATLAGLEVAIHTRLGSDDNRLCLLFDRFDGLPPQVLSAVSGGLRALRDAHKYALTYIIAARCPPDPRQELAELFFANTIWLGPLSASDARWSIARFVARRRLEWNSETVQRLIELSGSYPSLLRAACEACAASVPLQADALLQHPALRQRLAEFWSDNPSPAALAASRLAHIPLLGQPELIHTPELTAKEQLLLAYFQAHAGQVCQKDDLIHSVWPEDRVFQGGVRDDSLAQLVRRLREKVEPDPSQPRFINTVPGRGYRYK
jgi:energy-coupling factor transporter ATP-binding protein EcfA2